MWGPAQEDATDGECRTSHLGVVLLRGDTGGAVVWGVDLCVVVSNGAEARGS